MWQTLRTESVSLRGAAREGKLLSGHTFMLFRHRLRVRPPSFGFLKLHWLLCLCFGQAMLPRSLQRHGSRRHSLLWKNPEYSGLRNCSHLLDWNRIHRRSYSALAVCQAQSNPGPSPPEKNNTPSLQDLEAEFARLHGQPVNVNSPKQVSTAIFGSIQSTARDRLERVIEGSLFVPSLNGPRLAALVLQHRALAKILEDTAGTVASNKTGRSRVPSRRHLFSTSAAPAIDPEEDEPEMLVSSPVAAETPEIAFQRSSLSHTVSSESVSTNSPYERQVEALFQHKTTLIHTYWQEPLLQVTRPSARTLVAQLDATQCPMGYNPLAQPMDPLRGTVLDTDAQSSSSTTATTTAGKKGSFLAYCRQQKESYPDCIILTRCGDFYETFGLDAVMLVEHCGLNPMGNKAKAGCPYRNVQATIDGLISQGFRVAVYEEAPDTDSSTGTGATGGAKSRIKSRFLAQIVSTSSPTYLYGLVLLSNADTLVTAPPSRPHVGILSLAAGYTMVEISIEERSVRVSDRLTPEAVACRLAAYPPADPLFYVPSEGEYEYKCSTSDLRSLPFLPSRRDSFEIGSSGARLRTIIIPPTVVEGPGVAGVSEAERAKRIITASLLDMIKSPRSSENIASDQTATVEDFTLLAPSNTQADSHTTSTNPLYVETAMQLGLMNDYAIPSLVSHILPESAPAATRRFLRRFLLTPPPPRVGDAMATLVRILQSSDASLPPLTVPPVGKVLALLRAGQASAQVYTEMLKSMHSMVLLLDTFPSNSDFVQSLMTLLEYESGLAGDPDSLRDRCHEAIKEIEAIISPIHHSSWSELDPSAIDCITDFGGLVPRAFFERNEATWRGRVQPDVVLKSYTDVQRAAELLGEAVAKDFWQTPRQDLEGNPDTTSRSLIAQDIFNNILAMKEVPQGADKDLFFHPRDRNGKILRNRFTTEYVQSALSDYVAACDRACQDVTDTLVRLSQLLCDDGHIPAVVQASHANLILSSAFHHAVRANAAGWNLARTYEATLSEDTAGYLKDLWPYWMDKSEATSNSYELNGMWLLTAPNMSGKSTIMRSTAAAALLSVCGLCAPLGPGSSIRRFDHIFVRGASADVPSEQKSAFGAEMGDIAALLRSCGGKSLVFVDELGRGTSPRDGTRLAGAVLEAMTMSGMSGIFATHLHDVLDLPLRSKGRIVKKRMGVHKCHLDGHQWTYRLEDGVCTDSLALLTAARFGLPESVIQRAEALDSYIPRASSSVLPDNYKAQSIPDGVNGIPGHIFGLENIASLAEECTGVRSLQIPPQWNVPASLDGKSCIYILQMEQDGREAPRYYVGESDNLRKRLAQHRAKKGHWSNVTALALPAADKSQARAWESLIIRRLSKRGVSLISTTDGRSIRSARQ